MKNFDKDHGGRATRSWRLVRALFNSLAGLRSGFAAEPAFRLEVLLAIAAALALALLRPGLFWCLAAVFGWLLVMAVELLNSAIEQLFDMVQPEFDERVRRGKDMASAAVFLTVLGNGLLWLCMLADLIFAARH